MCWRHHYYIGGGGSLAEAAIYRATGRRLEGHYRAPHRHPHISLVPLLAPLSVRTYISRNENTAKMAAMAEILSERILWRCRYRLMKAYAFASERVWLWHCREADRNSNGNAS